MSVCLCVCLLSVFHHPLLHRPVLFSPFVPSNAIHHVLTEGSILHQCCFNPYSQLLTHDSIPSAISYWSLYLVLLLQHPLLSSTFLPPTIIFMSLSFHLRLDVPISMLSAFSQFLSTKPSQVTSPFLSQILRLHTQHHQPTLIGLSIS